ncbi:hypothetical protein [Roseivivax sp. CAU 1761]
MIKAVVLTATLTGVFCVGFTIFVAMLTEALSFLQIVGVSFVSGFLGSIFAQLVIKRGARP